MGCQLFSILQHAFKGVSSVSPGLQYLEGAEVSGSSVPGELCSLHYTSIPILTLPGRRELHFFFFLILLVSFIQNRGLEALT